MTMLPLAQVSPPPAAVASWLEVLFYLAGGVTMVVVCWHHLSGRGDAKRTPQPFEVKAHKPCASEDDLKEVHGRIKRERAELEEKIAALTAADVALREKLDAELAGVRQQLVDNNTASENRVVHLHDRMNSLPNEIIAVLRNTKGLL